MVCPGCEYLLRGLPDGRCPECGRTFARGRLLVEQYVLEGGRRFSRRAARAAKWCWVIAAGLMVLFWVVYGVVALAAARAASYADYMSWFDRSFELSGRLIPLFYLAPVLWFVAAILWGWVVARNGKKLRQVVAAIE